MRSTILLMLIMSFSVAVLTSSAMAMAETGKSTTSSPPTPVKLGADVNSLVFTGIIKKISGHAVLVTPKATYLLTGGNFDGIVGMKVNIIGKIIQEGSIEKIVVARAQLASN